VVLDQCIRIEIPFSICSAHGCTGKVDVSTVVSAKSRKHI
jgi:hypothetical protein